VDLAALGADVVDNLPGHLALEPAADGSPLRLAALLAGVDAGPLVTPWASLATLLWAAPCRAAGEPVTSGSVRPARAAAGPALLVGSVTALWLVHG